MTHTRRVLLLVLPIAAVSLAACGDDTTSSDSASNDSAAPPVTVAATTSIVGDLVANVGGDRAKVSVILPVNADPHDYEPRPSDATAVSEADIVVRSGGDLDEWLDDVVKNAGTSAREVTLIDAVPTREGEHGHEEEGEEHEGEEHEGEEGHAESEVDPHWWQNPANAVPAVEAIRAAFVAADPKGTATYDANAKAYTAKVKALDAAIATCMEAIPAGKRKLVTNHDAFGYYADRYEIETVGTVIPGLSTQAQASAGEVTALVRTIKREGVTTVFAENTINQKLEKAIAERAGAKVGPALWSDALGQEGSSGATYLAAMRFNTQALVDGFTGAPDGCTLPAE